MHLSPKYGSQKYLYWSFANFAQNYLDDSELEKFSEIKAKGEQEETNDTKYSQYQGASGKTFNFFHFEYSLPLLNTNASPSTSQHIHAADFVRRVLF